MWQNLIFLTLKKARQNLELQIFYRNFVAINVKFKDRLYI